MFGTQAGRSITQQEGITIMNKKEYNGWTNYETWLVNVWLENDTHVANYNVSLAHDSISEYEQGNEKCDWFHYEDIFKEDLQELLEGMHGMTHDLLSAAISEVDTRAIAKHWIQKGRDTPPLDSYPVGKEVSA
jgi:hypothetical protein